MKATTLVAIGAVSAVACGERAAEREHVATPELVQIASRVSPSVVRIVTREAPRVGMGAGVVIDRNGHILTNAHLVARMSELKVTFADGRTANARVVGLDVRTDLAVVKATRTEIEPVVFGDSDALEVGEWVMAIGSPFGLDRSVSVGVLSAKGRHGFSKGLVEDFLQTDASINPGSSGGPLVSLRGEVVGINTMIAGIGTGIGFAVPSSKARPVAEELMCRGKVTRAYIGVRVQTLTPELRATLGAGAPKEGVLIAQLQDGSPADRAGCVAATWWCASTASPSSSRATSRWPSSTSRWGGRSSSWSGATAGRAACG